MAPSLFECSYMKNASPCAFKATRSLIRSKLPITNIYRGSNTGKGNGSRHRREGPHGGKSNEACMAECLICGSSYTVCSSVGLDQGQSSCFHVSYQWSTKWSRGVISVHLESLKTLHLLARSRSCHSTDYFDKQPSHTPL